MNERLSKTEAPRSFATLDYLNDDSQGLSRLKWLYQICVCASGKLIWSRQAGPPPSSPASHAPTHVLRDVVAAITEISKGGKPRDWPGIPSALASVLNAFWIKADPKRRLQVLERYKQIIELREMRGA